VTRGDPARHWHHAEAVSSRSFVHELQFWPAVIYIDIAPRWIAFNGYFVSAGALIGTYYVD
jgi:hypothetical protein